MARIDTTGADAVIKQLYKAGQQSGPVAEAMVQAGAVKVREAWRASAERHGHRDTGAMIASISFPASPSNDGGIVSQTIAPKGKDSKGVRNGEKAFVLNYGTSRIRGSHWVQEAEQEAAPAVAEAMGTIWNSWGQTGSIPVVDVKDPLSGTGGGRRKHNRKK